MSRRKSPSNTNINTNAGGGSGPPGSHPSELYPEHRQFLVRSLERNDTDNAALMDLNKSLRDRRQSIVDLCGELTLLDLGLGHYKLSPASDALERTEDNNGATDGTNGTIFPDAIGQELCVDFLLRMKLRRRLLNRLARRLNRIATAMDGEDVSPPGPPKYGDLSLHVDPMQVQAFEEHWQHQEKARRKLDLEREKHLYADESTTEQNVVQQDKPVDESDAAKTEETPTKVEKAGTTNDEEAKKETEDTTQVVPVKTEDTTPEDEKPEDDALKKSHLVGPLDSVDYKVVREYSDAYEKVLDPTTGTFTYTIVDQDREEDHLAIKFGAGIGASHRSMSSKEKEAEWKRWQTSLLSRIPEQPTFDDLGMEHRVFLLEERRRRAVEEQKASPTKKPKAQDEPMDEDSPENTSKEDAQDDDEKDKDAMDTEEKDSNEEGDVAKKDDSETEKKEKEADCEKKEPESPLKKAKEDVEDVVEDEEHKDAAPKRMNPLSLAAVPSFHEQDLKRIKLVHAELMASSIQNHARRRLEAVTRDYNTGVCLMELAHYTIDLAPILPLTLFLFPYTALRESNQTFEVRQHATNKLNTVVYENHAHISNLKNEYSVEVAIAKSRWNKRREDFEKTKLDKMLPSRWGRAPDGSQMTKDYCARRDQISGSVGICLADIVDAVDMIAQGKVQNEKFREPYKPPAVPDFGSATTDQATGETVLQRHQRVEATLRQDMNALTMKLRSCEEDRQRAWKKMLKTKTEFDLPHHQVTNIHGGRIHVDRSNYHMMPLPALQTSAQQSVPQEAASRSMVPSYIPAHNRPLSMMDSGATSQSKYSAARVRERISADGSVAPVTEPKKTKEGLFQRPAGRTRKGMAWDALRGIWIPDHESRTGGR